jgi:hypothetical protein
MTRALNQIPELELLIKRLAQKPGTVANYSNGLFIVNWFGHGLAGMACRRRGRRTSHLYRRPGRTSRPVGGVRSNRCGRCEVIGQVLHYRVVKQGQVALVARGWRRWACALW